MSRSEFAAPSETAVKAGALRLASRPTGSVAINQHYWMAAGTCRAAAPGQGSGTLPCSRVPCEGLESTASVPPTAAMRSCMLLSPAPLGVRLGSNPQPVSQTVKCSAWAVSQARTETSRRSGVLGCVVDRREAGEVDRALDLGPAAAYPAR